MNHNTVRDAFSRLSRGTGFQTAQNEEKAAKVQNNKTNAKDGDKFAIVQPTTFASWAMGVFGGEDKLWINRYIETVIFREASKSIQKALG